MTTRKGPYMVEGEARPRTRAECPREGPCPWVSCRYHLAREEVLRMKRQGGGCRSFDIAEGGLPAPRWRELSDVCALDVAAKGGATMEEIGGLLGVTRERVRQIEAKALAKLLHRNQGNPDLRAFLEEEPIHHRVRLPLGDPCGVSPLRSAIATPPRPQAREEETPDGPKTEEEEAPEAAPLAADQAAQVADLPQPDHAVLEEAREPAEEEELPRGVVLPPLSITVRPEVRAARLQKEEDETPAQASRSTPEKTPEEAAPKVPVLEALKTQPEKEETMNNAKPALSPALAVALLEEVARGGPNVPLIRALAIAGGLLGAPAPEGDHQTIISSPDDHEEEEEETKEEEAPRTSQTQAPVNAPDVERIKEAVLSRLGLSEEDFGERQKGALARKLCWWLDRKLTGLTHESVALRWGSPKSTVDGALNTFEARLNKDPGVREQATGLLAELRSAASLNGAAHP